MELYKYVDVHAHLDDKSFDADRENVLRRASDVLVLNAGIDHQSNLKTLELASSHGNVKACLGLHPEYAFGMTIEQVYAEVDFISRYAHSIVAISEIGLDYKFEDRENQKAAFRAMLKLAEELDKPVVVHSRRAAGGVLKVLHDFHVPVNLHAFSGTLEETTKGCREGYYFSFGPNLTYNEQKRKLVEAVPLEQILTETDSPVLGSDPTERNEPENIKIAVKKIAEIKNSTIEETQTVILKNAKQLFEL